MEFACAWANEAKLHAHVQESLAESQQRQPEYQEKQGWVRIAFQNAFWQLLHSETMEEGIVNIVSQVRDTENAVAGFGKFMDK